MNFIILYYLTMLGSHLANNTESIFNDMGKHDILSETTDEFNFFKGCVYIKIFLKK